MRTMLEVVCGQTVLQFVYDMYVIHQSPFRLFKLIMSSSCVVNSKSGISVDIFVSIFSEHAVTTSTRIIRTIKISERLQMFISIVLRSSNSKWSEFHCLSLAHMIKQRETIISPFDPLFIDFFLFISFFIFFIIAERTRSGLFKL